MIELVIVRHGNTFDPGDTVTRVGGRTDLALSPSGRTQAAALSMAFADTMFETATASPLRRTRETAQTLLAGGPSPPALETADFLREIDYGPDENQPEDAVIARLGQDALAAWDAEAVMPADWSPRPEAITDGWRRHLHALLAHQPSGSRHLIVTSNGIARFIFAAIDASPLPADLKLKTGAWGRFLLAKDFSAAMLEWNCRP